MGIVAVLSTSLPALDTGPILFVGIGITFLLVAVLTGMRWAYIPGVVLLVLAALVGTASANVLNYIWPAILILAGLLMIWQFVRRA